jgi:hypothetical protein
MVRRAGSQPASVVFPIDCQAECLPTKARNDDVNYKRLPASSSINQIRFPSVGIIRWAGSSSG